MQSKKLFILSTGLLPAFNTTLGSSLPSGATEILADHFSISSQRQIVLPVAVFLIGYIFGPIIFCPLSERRICLLSSFGLYTGFTLGCALAPNWSALITFRFIVGIGLLHHQQR